MVHFSCKDCEHRQLGCHAKCEDYITKRKQLDDENRARQEQGRLDRALFGIKRSPALMKYAK